MNSFKVLLQRHKWLFPLLILVLTVLIITLLMVTKPKPVKQETKEKAWLVLSQHLKFGLASPQIQLLGHVESPFDSTLSGAISADVLAVFVRDGQVVKKGEILIELDARKIDLSVIQQQADVNELKAQISSENNRFTSDKVSLNEEQKLLDLAKKGVKRQAKLKASKSVAQERYDNAESQLAQQALSLNARKLNIADHPSRLAQLNARLARAKTALSEALLDADRAHIKAPFNGVITAVDIAPGERVQVGQPLLSMYDRNAMEIRAQIPDRYVSLIKSSLEKGAVIRAQSLSYGNTNTLQLKRLSGQANRGTGGIDALFTLVNSFPSRNHHELIPEDQPSLIPEDINNFLVLNSTLKIQIELPPLTNVVTLPLSAIYGSNRIYRIEEGRLQSLNVSLLGKRLSPHGEQDQVIIKSKLLKDGDVITTTQLPNAISGLKVIERSQ